MNEMETSQGKLLFMIYKLSSTRFISQRDKDYLKDLIIEEDPKILTIMNDYNSNGTQLTLKNNILALLWGDKSHKSPIDRQSLNSSNSSVQRRKPKGLQVKIPIKNIQKIQGRTW